jgi:hypothetical protein
MRSARKRVLAILAGAVITTLAACVDTVTSPPIPGKRALKDTTVIEGDSTLCRSGYHIVGGRIVCLGDQ